MQHIGAVRRGQDSNALAKHHKTKHRGQAPVHKTKILRGNIKFNLDRFILEAISIDDMKNVQNMNLLNQKSEWGHHGLPRLGIT